MTRARNFIFAAIVLLTPVPGFGAESAIKAPKSPLAALVENKTFTGDVSKSELTVLQFWASWCTGCAVVMNQITELVTANPEIGYVSVSLDETKDIAVKYFANKSKETQGTMRRSYLDPSGQIFSEANGVDSLPYLIIVNKQGKIIKRISGHPTKADLAILLKKG